MENTLFDKFDMLEQVPTDLMTEITEPTGNGLTDAASHTEIKATDYFEGNSTGQQSQPTGTAPQPFKNDFSGGSQPQPQRMNAGNLITGQMAVNFLDMLMPVICVLLIEKINGKKASKKWFVATPDEKKILEPVLHNYLNSINFNVDNPLNALLITVAFIYGTKTVEVLNNVQQQPQGVNMPQAFSGQRVETRGRKKGGHNKPKK